MSEPLPHLPKSRRLQQQIHPVPVVTAIIRGDHGKESTYLLIKRIHPPYVGKWALVGGKWDFGETLSQAVTREVWEEIGLITHFIALREFVNERIIPHQSQDLGAHISKFVCEVRTIEGEPREQDEGAVAWYSESQLNDLWYRQEIVPTDYLILQNYLTVVQSLSYVEAEVVAEATGSSTNEINRFERIS